MKPKRRMHLDLEALIGNVNGFLTPAALAILLLTQTGAAWLGHPGGEAGHAETERAAPLVPWNNAGHRIVCQVAWERLTEPTRQALTTLLASDPEYAEFAPSCVWADEIRARIRAGARDVQRLDRYTPAHFMNTPPGRSGVDMESCTERTESGPGRPCVVDAIHEMADSLVSAVDVAHRLEALKFIGHFVGDVHQPLHAGYGHDRGGNDFEVSAMGLSQRSLHWAWDVFFLEQSGWHWQDLARDLADGIRPIDAQMWASLDPVQWANESYQLVETEVYVGLEADGAYIGQEYYDRHILTVRRQLTKAGVRLGLLLNSLLDPGVERTGPS